MGNANNSPFFGRDYQYQYVANGNWAKGSHELRWGFDIYQLHLNQGVANAAGAVGGPAGGFLFRNATTTLRGGPAANDYNTIGAFLLGLAASRAETYYRCRSTKCERPSTVCTSVIGGK